MNGDWLGMIRVLRDRRGGRKRRDRCARQRAGRGQREQRRGRETPEGEGKMHGRTDTRPEPFRIPWHQTHVSLYL
jgi:hypothetical protein